MAQGVMLPFGTHTFPVKVPDVSPSYSTLQCSYLHLVHLGRQQLMAQVLGWAPDTHVGDQDRILCFCCAWLSPGYVVTWKIFLILCHCPFK